ncbi:hypothetical protein C0J52_00051 [Blattella germanica]|nr:hypothetical protein C0J52_00051 [Blattella germanica]
MHATTVERNSWRLPPDDTVQVADQRSKSAEDLVLEGAQDSHNWRSIVLSLLVISCVIVGILTAIYLLGYVDEMLYWSGRRMKLEEYLQGELNPRRMPPVWISHTHFIFQTDDGGLAYLDTSNDSVSLLVTNHTLRTSCRRQRRCGDPRMALTFSSLRSTTPRCGSWPSLGSGPDPSAGPSREAQGPGQRSRSREPFDTPRDLYLTSAGWVGQDNHHVSAVWMNRAQNVSIITSCRAPNWTCFETHTERASEDTWLDVQPHPVYTADGESFLLLASIKEGAHNHFTHIKHVTPSQQRIAVLTHGSYEVTRILSWDTTNHLVYYLGTQPGQRHLYVVRDPATDDPRRLEPQCVTCDLWEVLWSSRYWYTNCTHFTASVSPGNVSGSMSYYVLECEGPGLPLAGVHSAGTHQELRDAAFPVLVEVNGRPGSQAVSEKFSVSWGTYMSSHNDVVYVKLDVRGARGQGSRSLYRHLGGVEVQDQVTVLRYLLDHLKFLDETRVGVWGWGYGGYVTAMLLGSQQNIFKCGIAVSPIADWLYYNSAFTERILGVPGENFKGYVEADATQRARNVPSHSMYLLHGLADITTPYQHGVALARALADAGIIFRYQVRICTH